MLKQVFDVKTIEEKIKLLLKEHHQNRHSSYHTPTFSYITLDKRIKSDTVVLRHVKNNVLQFHTDIRSTKIEALKNNANSSLHFYSREDKTQISMQVQTNVLYNNTITKARWDNTPILARQCYQQEKLPINPIENSTDKLIEGYLNFAMIECTIKNMDVLWLSAKGNRRYLIDCKTHTTHEVAP